MGKKLVARCVVGVNIDRLYDNIDRFNVVNDKNTLFLTNEWHHANIGLK